MKSNIDECIRSNIKKLIKENMDSYKELMLTSYNLKCEIVEKLTNETYSEQIMDKVKMKSTSVSFELFGNTYEMFVNCYYFYGYEPFYENYDKIFNAYDGLQEINCYAVSGTINEENLRNIINTKILQLHHIEKDGDVYNLPPLYYIASKLRYSWHNDIVKKISELLYYSSQKIQTDYANILYGYLFSFGYLIIFWSDVMDSDTYKILYKIREINEELQENLNNDEWIEICNKRFKCNINKIYETSCDMIESFERKIADILIKLHFEICYMKNGMVLGRDNFYRNPFIE